MSVFERERQTNLPPIEPPDSEFWASLEGQFRPPQIEPSPQDHLVGRKVLEDQISNAEIKFECGLPLDQTDMDLLQLSRDVAFDDYEI